MNKMSKESKGVSTFMNSTVIRTLSSSKILKFINKMLVIKPADHNSINFQPLMKTTQHKLNS